MAKKVEINGTVYNKTQFGRRWSGIVSSYEVGVSLTPADRDFMTAVCLKLDRYRKKASEPGATFRVVSKEFNGKRVKGIVLVTASSHNEMWIGKADTMNRIFKGGLVPDPSKRNRADAIRALRRIIEPQIAQYRRSNAERLRGGLYHIDHVYPFKLLVQEWCRENRLDLETIPVKCRGASCRLKSIDMAESWFDYHALNARLQVLEPKENLSKGSKYFG